MQSRAIERKKKDGGELMRNLHPSITPLPTLQTYNDHARSYFKQNCLKIIVFRIGVKK